MLFTSVVFAGLAALAIAAPRPGASIGEPGLRWKPRSLQQRGGGNSKNKDVLTVIDTTVVKLDEKTRNSEVELTVLVQKKIIEDKSSKSKDNVRKNHYKSKNRDVNTVIIVVTQIIDIRDSKNHNTRYLRRQIKGDNNAKQDVTVQVTELLAITISNDSNGHSKGGNINTGAVASASLASAAAAAIQTLEPNAPYAASNATSLLPSGASAPIAPPGGAINADPAAIVEDGQPLYVANA